MPPGLPSRHDRTPARLLDERPFRILLGVGIALLVMGATDLALALLPPRFGDPQWEFGTFSAILNGMPVPAMGAALVMAAGIAMESFTAVAAVVLWSIVLTLLLLVCATLYLLDIPLALKAVTQPSMLGPLKAAILKAGAAFVTYVALWVFLMYHGARFLRTK